MTEDRETIAYNMLDRQRKRMYIAQVKNSAKVHLREASNLNGDSIATEAHRRNFLADLASLRLLLSETLYNDFITELES